MEHQLLDSCQQENIASSVRETQWMQQEAVIFDMLKPELKKDGDQWCCIKGILPEDDCIYGFGDTPAKAINAFYRFYQGILK